MLLRNLSRIRFVSRRNVLMEVLNALRQKMLIDVDENSVAIERDISVRKSRTETCRLVSETLFPFWVDRLVQAQRQRTLTHTPVHFFTYTNWISNNGVAYLGLWHHLFFQQV